MTIKMLLVIIVAVSLSAFAQITLKYGMSSPQVQKVIRSASWCRIAWTLGTNWGVLSGLFIYSASMILWLFVLARIDVSQAYPFVGAGFLITMTFGHYFLGESLSLYRIVGTMCVTIGIILVSIR